ncbi:hypothetical protein C7974DRAFT_396572 [Boeremia exigua]|uniref:uncharacterized protein n=1 Tax=Boeremia exigua TaxID=749465 RepID=UPI001E8CB243|nr:uncharacterized protein C7974DRAFT_396572 [Boeremia exigua]KAH6625701.1 hypothetical protein C7974DRAFT_396572 [Boeremia exigua]
MTSVSNDKIARSIRAEGILFAEPLHLMPMCCRLFKCTVCVFDNCARRARASAKNAQSPLSAKQARDIGLVQHPARTTWEQSIPWVHIAFMRTEDDIRMAARVMLLNFSGGWLKIAATCDTPAVFGSSSSAWSYMSLQSFKRNSLSLWARNISRYSRAWGLSTTFIRRLRGCRDWDVPQRASSSSNSGSPSAATIQKHYVVVTSQGGRGSWVTRSAATRQPTDMSERCWACWYRGGWLHQRRSDRSCGLAALGIRRKRRGMRIPVKGTASYNLLRLPCRLVHGTVVDTGGPAGWQSTEEQPSLLDMRDTDAVCAPAPSLCVTGSL